MLETRGGWMWNGVVRVTALAVMSTATWLGGTAAAQTTVVLNQGGTQVTDTTIRNGTYANTNYDGGVLCTRASTDPDWERRALVKFDTSNTIPAGAQVTSAVLTLTVKSGLGSGTTRVGAYRVPEGFYENEATWNERMTGAGWSTPGGGFAENITGGDIPPSAGSRVSFDVTALVQNVVNGNYGVRWTRIGLADWSGDSKDSYREYYSSEDGTTSRRPTLTVTYASSGSAPPPSSSGTLKVLQWNIAQGYGTDGKSNLDRLATWIAKWRPDVISFNEIMRYSSSSQPQMIADKLRAKTGETWTYKWVQKWGASSGEGECVMTRLGIDATDQYLLSYDRSVAMARVNVNGRIVNVFSTHLDHTSSALRLTQVKQLVPWAATHSEQRIVAGDFNWYPGTTEINEMGETYRDGWVVAKSGGDAFSYPGNPDGNTRNNRIDYIWFSKGATAVSVVRAEVFDTRDSSGAKPSDHNPVMVTFRVQ
jgi:endonuclease/exonuclease/phosphatase family metal-dependent hydrolase